MLYKIYFGKWKNYYSLVGLNEQLTGQVIYIKQHAYFIPNEYFNEYFVGEKVFKTNQLSYYDGINTWRLF